MLAQNVLLTYLLLSSLTTSLPNLLSTELRLMLFGLSGELSPCPSRWAVSRETGDCRSPPFSSTWAPKLCTTPSSFFNRASNSASGGFLDLRGARPGPGKTHSMPALTQFEHGLCLLHLTFLRRHVTQERGLRSGLASDLEDALVGCACRAPSSGGFDSFGVTWSGVSIVNAICRAFALKGKYCELSCGGRRRLRLNTCD